MQLLVNDLSLHGQFPDIATFKDAISRIMSMRVIARQFGCELYCHRNIAWAQVTYDLRMQQVVNTFDRNEQRVIMQWLTRSGPFWEDTRIHSSDDYMECNGAVVTDTAIGEAAYCCFHSTPSDLVSLTPSSWEFSPLFVTWVFDSGDYRSIEIINHWNFEELKVALQAAPMPIMSWEQLAAISNSRCTYLSFSKDCFAPLRGYPFVSSAAQRLLFILDTLNRLKSSFDADGQRTPEGHEIYRNFFTGKKGRGGRGALFTDSSEDEKNKFEKEMTFRHPADASTTLFCSWHGKVQTPQLRVHFSFPIRADEPLYVVYVGPKMTKG